MELETLSPELTELRNSVADEVFALIRSRLEAAPASLQTNHACDNVYHAVLFSVVRVIMASTHDTRSIEGSVSLGMAAGIKLAKAIGEGAAKAPEPETLN